ncbi:hypothetical protein BN871_CK_00160 [Paenibacillus sp. P22]|nr:hypothetical protein BN871_CK_00160 [Paenibacillus sp. P22]
MSNKAKRCSSFQLGILFQHGRHFELPVLFIRRVQQSGLVGNRSAHLIFPHDVRHRQYMARRLHIRRIQLSELVRISEYGAELLGKLLLLRFRELQPGQSRHMLHIPNRYIHRAVPPLPLRHSLYYTLSSTTFSMSCKCKKEGVRQVGGAFCAYLLACAGISLPGREIDLGARLHDLALQAEPSQALDKSAGILMDGRKRIVMNRDDMLRSIPFGRLQGILWSHREMASDRDEGDIRLAALADQSHVREQTSIAGVQNPLAVHLNDKSGRHAAVNDSLLVIQHDARTVEGRYHRRLGEPEVDRSAHVHADRLGTLPGHVGSQFGNSDDRSSVRLGNVGGVQDMILMRMSKKNVIRADIGRIALGQRIAA